MKTLWLILSPAFFVPAFALLDGFSEDLATGGGGIYLDNRQGCE